MGEEPTWKLIRLQGFSDWSKLGGAGPPMIHLVSKPVDEDSSGGGLGLVVAEFFGWSVLVLRLPNFSDAPGLIVGKSMCRKTSP